jgi:hypothetical protein
MSALFQPLLIGLSVSLKKTATSASSLSTQLVDLFKEVIEFSMDNWLELAIYESDSPQDGDKAIQVQSNSSFRA